TLHASCAMEHYKHKESHAVNFDSVHCMPDNQSLVATTNDGLVYVLDYHGALRAALRCNAFSWFHAAATSPDGTTLAVSSTDDSTIRLWQPSDEQAPVVQSTPLASEQGCRVVRHTLQITNAPPYQSVSRSLAAECLALSEFHRQLGLH